MRVTIIHQGQTTIIEDFEQVVVEQADGTPVAVAAKHGPHGLYIVSSIDDGQQNFNHVLHMLGLNRTVIVTNLRDKMSRAEFLPNVL